MVESWFCEQLFMSMVTTCYSNYLGEKYKRKKLTWLKIKEKYMTLANQTQGGVIYKKRILERHDKHWSAFLHQIL